MDRIPQSGNQSSYEDKGITRLFGRAYGSSEVPGSDTVVLGFPGILSCAEELHYTTDGIFPYFDKIFINNRGHGYPDEMSDGTVSYDALCSDIGTVFDLADVLGYKKKIAMFCSMSCIPGTIQLLDSARDGNIRQDMTILISPPDNFYKYLDWMFALGSRLANNNDKKPFNYLSVVSNWFIERICNHRFEQLNGDTHIRYLDISKNMSDTLRALSNFPSISETYMSEEYDGVSLLKDGKKHPVLVIYGEKDSVVPPDDMRMVIEAMKKRDALVIPMRMDESSHHVTAEGAPDGIYELHLETDKKKIEHLRDRFSFYSDHFGLEEPSEEIGLEEMERRIDRASEFFEPKSYGLSVEKDRTLICIGSFPDDSSCTDPGD